MSAKVPQMKAANAVSNLDHLCQLDPNAKTAFIRLTGLICTIGLYYLVFTLLLFLLKLISSQIAFAGPASQKPEMLEKMMEAGMNIARLNFSHGM